MDYGILILIIIVLIPLIYFIYFWTNSEILSKQEITELSCFKRFWDLHNYLDFTESQFSINKEFKSALNKNGQLYNCNETLSDFPGIAAALLKSKKHEWVVFAFAKNKNVNAFYTNKGNDNQSVAPNITPEQITKLANDNDADFVLQFHNHPNAILSASSQDLTSAKHFGNIFNYNSLNYLAFVCGAGRFHQYGWWITESFFSLDQYFTAIEKENGESRSKNYELRKELKRKRDFKNFRLNNNSSHNISSVVIIKKSQNELNRNKKDHNIDYLQEVLNVFKENLKNYPKDQHTKMELMENMGDNKDEKWNKYYYSLPKKEFGIFERMEMIDHSELHKTFILSTNKFSINDLEYLVSIFYPILGNDVMGKGKFDIEDQNQIASQNFWFGRSWTDYKKYKCAATLFFYNDVPRLDLCIKW